MKGFAAAYGTLLYFEETDTVKKLQEQFPGYAANFPVWASQGNGMLQFALWTALTDMGLGVNIQHYNPIIDAAIKEAFEVPESWTWWPRCSGPEPPIQTHRKTACAGTGVGEEVKKKVCCTACAAHLFLWYNKNK